MTMKDASGYDAPASNAFAVTPNDSANLTHAARALFVGGAGAVKVDTLGGDTVTFTGAEPSHPAAVSAELKLTCFALEENV